MKLSRRRLIKVGTCASLSLAMSQNLLGRLWSDKGVQKHMKLKPIKIALLGLGSYAKNWIAPAIQQSDYAQVSSIITGSPEKIAPWKKAFSIKDENIYNYQNFDQIANNPEIDCVYVATPTGTHADFTIRSLQAKKHVICEKPMAPTVADCDRMIQAAKIANKTLQIGYRLYWDPFNIRLMDAMKNKEFGQLEGMQGGFSYDHGNLTKEGDWRINSKMNPGGALFDVGVYVAQSAFYSSQMLPLSVTAQHSTDRLEIFKDVPEHWKWELTWPNQITSQHSSSYGKQENFLRLETEGGRLEIEPAYSYENLKGSTPKGPMDFTHIFQQKLQIDGQCLAIHKRSANITGGEMGRRDVHLLNCIMEAAETQSVITLGDFYT